MSISILKLIPESLRPDLIKEIIGSLSTEELKKALDEKIDPEEDDIRQWAERENKKKE